MKISEDKIFVSNVGTSRVNKSLLQSILVSLCPCRKWPCITGPVFIASTEISPTQLNFVLAACIKRSLSTIPRVNVEDTCSTVLKFAHADLVTAASYWRLVEPTSQLQYS